MKKFLITLSIFISVFSICFVGLAFTDIPYYAYHDLALKKQKLSSPPDEIILLGGQGMPSPSALMRIYFAAKAAKEFPEARVWIALPFNQGNDSLKQLNLIKNELILKGINRNRIKFEPQGYNTYTQAQELKEVITDGNKVLIVSSPEHMYRAVRTFEKIGFSEVGSYPAFESPEDAEKLKGKKKKDKQEVEDLKLRYNLWSYMQYEIIVLREYVAISYYWVNGWI